MPRTKTQVIDEDVIARKAYELWASRGYPEGTAEDDWYTAEAHLHGNGAAKKRARQPTIR